MLRNPLAKKIALVFTVIALPVLIIEIAFQIAHLHDIYEINKRKKDVDFDRYDPYFGWVGIPGNKGLIHGENNNFYFENNGSGFRDVEHDNSVRKPAVVFLGGSFVWGYDLQTEEMFVNIIRENLNDHEVFNLSGVCYGPGPITPDL